VSRRPQECADEPWTDVDRAAPGLDEPGYGHGV
jgi:hypothetical protein